MWFEAGGNKMESGLFLHAALSIGDNKRDFVHSAQEFRPDAYFASVRRRWRELLLKLTRAATADRSFR